MKAVITGENDRLVGVNLLDNNDAEHVIEMKKDGTITAHQQDGYADDPDNRTEEENEHVNQTRRFAKFHVYRERGYDTLEHIENPDYIDAVRQAILQLSDAEFEQYFGALHQQLRSHHESVDRPVNLPAGVQKPDAVIYKLDTYLGVDIAESGLTEQARALAEAHSLEYEPGTTPKTGAAVSEADLEEWTEFGEHLMDLANPDDLELELSAVSGIHVGYPDARGEHEVEWNDSPLEREPDARLELMPADPGSLEEFREYLDHHLRCQIRDCFVGMGQVPPEPYRVVGFGKFIYARRYDHYDLYPQLHLRDGDHNAVIR
ncbi:hypothetical protein G6M89_03155 [Natronolimnobius sp. AArcel1]|uniref:hypothetical protein n=1 Tax=Natronolimnobius sp. AArcel1 TaxID=1679093 RepID=UPI0013ED9B1F|nr:hypothetical protein [Natronolimnobius sp. AArcel1]NGM68020.1 hypothetical protein [Natronolimnobius sp. AArcel1]